MPRVDMVVTDDTVNLLQRDADIALRHVRPQQQELLCKRVGRLEMGLFARADYVAKQGVINADNLARHRFIDGVSRDYLVRGAAKRGLEIAEHQVVLRSDSLACQRAAVRSGWGIAVVPLWMAARETDWVSVFSEDEVIDIDVWLVARPEVRDNDRLFDVYRMLGEGLGQHLTGT